ncbi:MAG TPA: GNAT family N-acetyltransferase [Thermomicrobiales bacterium]|nr:GNAT family N-acetyltransferase [Thermomicrobiales bacterium]
MQHGVAVRTARSDDVPAVQRVAAVTWRATYAGQIPEADIAQFLESAYSERNLTAALSRLADGFIVAESDGVATGYAMAGLNREGEPELYALYVLPEHQGAGVGQALWDAAKAALAVQGYSRMCCWVLAGNDRARHFYERQGAFLSEEREFAIGTTMVREARYCVAIGR